MGSKVLGRELTSGLDLKGEQELGKAIPSRGKERIKGSQLRRVKQNQQHWLGSDFEETYLLQVLFPKKETDPLRAVLLLPSPGTVTLFTVEVCFQGGNQDRPLPSRFTHRWCRTSTNLKGNRKEHFHLRTFFSEGSKGKEAIDSCR